MIVICHPLQETGGKLVPAPDAEVWSVPTMPALLSDVLPDERPIFVPRLIGQRPALAALVAETISTWSYAENALGRSIAAMSRGINSVEMEDYIANRQLSRRLAIARRVSASELQPPYLPTFLRGLDAVEATAKHRHAFAHGVWGNIEALPDALLLVDPEHVLRHWGAANDWLEAFTEGGPGAGRRFGHFDSRHVEVWSHDDLQEEIIRMTRLYNLVLALASIAGNDPFDESASRRRHIHGLLLSNAALWPVE